MHSKWPRSHTCISLSKKAGNVENNEAMCRYLTLISSIQQYAKIEKDFRCNTFRCTLIVDITWDKLWKDLKKRNPFGHWLLLCQKKRKKQLHMNTTCQIGTTLHHFSLAKSSEKKSFRFVCLHFYLTSQWIRNHSAWTAKEFQLASPFISRNHAIFECVSKNMNQIFDHPHMWCLQYLTKSSPSNCGNIPFHRECQIYIYVLYMHWIKD